MFPRLVVVSMIILICQVTCGHFFVHSTGELYVTERIESDHMPLKLRVMLPKENVYNAEAYDH